MTRNLIAEMVKIGIPANQAAKEIAKAISVSEKTARNKINSVTGFTVSEAVKINDVFFGGKEKLDYLFENYTEQKGLEA